MITNGSLRDSRNPVKDVIVAVHTLDSVRSIPRGIPTLPSPVKVISVFTVAVELGATQTNEFESFVADL